MSKWGVLLVIQNFSELDSLANNAKIRSSLKFLLIRYMTVPKPLNHHSLIKIRILICYRFTNVYEIKVIVVQNS